MEEVLKRTSDEVKLEVVNAAFKKIGFAQLKCLDPNGSALERWVFFKLDELRRKTLQLRAWHFASRVVTLTDESASADTKAPQSSTYALPADCLVVLGVNAGGWQVVGRRVICRQGSIKLHYTADVKDFAELSPRFLEVLSYAVAYEAAQHAGISGTLVQMLHEQYEMGVNPFRRRLY